MPDHTVMERRETSWHMSNTRCATDCRSFAKQATPRSNLARVAMLVKLDSNGTATLQVS